ncbi:hypothetical protein IT411_01090 [Candidatus Peregrinibacteria bacterium]|nr:hypothetical protein [Candidatus Peregrinibacteria bacterium]
MSVKIKKFSALIILAFLLFSNSFQAIAATITVDSFNDNGAGGDCELRDAINSANNNAAFDNCTPGDPYPIIDNITFATGSPPPIVLNGTALPTITEAVTIDGDLNDDLTPDISISAGGNSRILDVDSTEVTVDGLTFLNGASSGPGDVGGSVRVRTAADLTLLNSYFNTGTAEKGGELGIESGANLVYLNNVGFEHGTAQQGGAMYIGSDANQVTLDETGFSTNSADEGGSIYLDQETVNVDPEVIDLSIDHTTITDSDATNGNGGAIYLGDNNEVQIAHTNITTVNASENGGAIYHAGESVNPPSDTQDLNLDEVNISDAHANGAAGQGGGIYLGPGMEAVSNGFNSIDTSSAIFGGGIYVGGNNGSFTLSAGDAIQSSTADYGGGIFVDTSGMLQIGGLLGLEPQFISNTANIAGGGIYINDYANTTIINHTIFSNNSSLIDGGGIALSPGTTMYLNDSVLFHNEASNTSGKGGGIFAYDNYSPGEEKTVYLTNVELSQNRAYDGGGVYGGNRSDLIFNNVFSNIGNTGDGAGGFLEMGTAGGDGTLNMTNSSIIGNVGGYCGALVLGSAYNPLSPPIQISNTVVNNNQSNIGFGGALCLNVGSMLLDNVDFSNNNSVDSAGALFLSDNGNNSSTEIINGSDFDQNFTAYSGGAIYVSQNLYSNTVTVNGSTFTSTSPSGSYGGFIYNQDGTLDVSNSTFNSSGVAIAGTGGAIANSGDLSLNNVSINDTGSEYYGGAIYNEGIMDILNSSLVNNFTNFFDGGGIYNEGDLTIDQSFIDSNHATSTGGGIYHILGNLIINNSTISQNTSDTHGGGLYMSNPITSAIINSSTIANNIASGGNGGGLANDSTGPLNISNTIFAYNSATGLGQDC